MRRCVAVALTTAGLALGAAAPAGAWWAEGGGFRSGAYGVVFVHAEPGEGNALTARNLPVDSPLAPTAIGGVVLHDPANPVTPPPAGSGQGCEQVDAHTLNCHGLGWLDTPISVVYLEVHLGDGDDRLRVPPGSSLFKLGSMGAGNDVVAGEDLRGASIDLGDGNDRITLLGSEGGLLPGDYVGGGAGDDVLRVLNGDADDNPVCGEGNDTLFADVGESHATCETHLP